MIRDWLILAYMARVVKQETSGAQIVCSKSQRKTPLLVDLEKLLGIKLNKKWKLNKKGKIETKQTKMQENVSKTGVGYPYS